MQGSDEVRMLVHEDAAWSPSAPTLCRWAMGAQVLATVLVGTVLAWHDAHPAIALARDGLFVSVSQWHEYTHAIAALASGGRLLGITIAQDAGGATTTDGGIIMLIDGVGYLGAGLVGALTLAAVRRRGFATSLLITLGLIVLVVRLFVPMDRFTTGVVIATGAGCLAGAWLSTRSRAWAVLGPSLRVLGTAWCLAAAWDVWHDCFGGTRSGATDADAFARVTGVHAGLIATVWLAALIVLSLCAIRWSLYRDPPPPPKVMPARVAIRSA